MLALNQKPDPKPLRRLLKFLHTMGAVGMIGSMASLLVCMIAAPPPSDLAGYALIHAAMSDIATWILFPSLALTLVPGMLAMAVNNAYKNAGWAWAKLATGVLLFEGGLVYVEGPIREEAKRSAAALAGQLERAEITGSYGAEQSSMWVLLLVCTANVVLGVWRPKFTKLRN